MIDPLSPIKASLNALAPKRLFPRSKSLMGFKEWCETVYEPAKQRYEREQQHYRLGGRYWFDRS